MGVNTISKRACFEALQDYDKDASNPIELGILCYVVELVEAQAKENIECPPIGFSNPMNSDLINDNHEVMHTPTPRGIEVASMRTFLEIPRALHQ